MKKSIYMFLLFFGVIIVYLGYHLQIDSCNDKGLVWDYEQKRCRNDCLKWGYGYGCIKLSDDEINQFSKCAIKSKCITNQQFMSICLRNNKAYNLKENICDFNFDKSNCKNKLQDWEYPSICEEV